MECCLVAKLGPTLLRHHEQQVPPLSTGFHRQEYWSGLPFPSPVDLPRPGTELKSSALAGGFFTTVPRGEPTVEHYLVRKRSEVLTTGDNMDEP